MRYLNQDPYVLYNGPNASPPPHWDRIKVFIYACALYAEENELNKLKAQVIGGEKKRLAGLKKLFGK